MKKDIKEWELEEVRPITGFSVAFKDAWDRWQLQTILHHRAASSQEKIRDSSTQAHLSPLLPPPLHSHPPPPPHIPNLLFLPFWGFSLAGRFDVAQCERAAVSHRAAAALLGHWGGRPTVGIRLDGGSISGALRCPALSGLIKALRQG